MRTLTIIFFSIGLIIGIGLLFNELKDEFRLSNITYEFPSKSNSEPPSLSPSEKDKLHDILSQSFSYLGKGHQTYAFASADDRYVLKFIKFTYLKPSWILNFMPSFPYVVRYKERKNLSQAKRYDRVFNGYKTAFEKNRENSGLLFIHLTNSQPIKQSVEVKDRFGIRRTINLDEVVFIVQKKATMTRDVLKQLIDTKHIDAAIDKIRQIFKLFISEYKKNLYDRDHNIMYNTGFVDSNPIRIDVGRLSTSNEISDPKIYKNDLVKIARKRIIRWLKTYYPEHKQEMTEKIELLLEELLGEKVSLS